MGTKWAFSVPVLLVVMLLGLAGLVGGRFFVFFDIYGSVVLRFVSYRVRVLIVVVYLL
jgi:hypothetical protein